VFDPANGILALGESSGERLEYVLMGLSVLVAIAGIMVARRWFLAQPAIPQALKERFSAPYNLLWNKYYVDEAYDAAVVNPVAKGSEKLLWKGIDVGVIDWVVNAGARLVGWLSGTLRVMQTGIAHSYILVFLGGVIALLGWVLLR